MQSLSGRKTESYFTDTNLIKTCKLLNLFRYHCNDPSLASELPSHDCIGPPGQRHGCKKKELSRQNTRVRTSTCVAPMRFHLRGGFRLIVIGGSPFSFCTPYTSAISRVSLLLPLLVHIYREAGPLQRATRAARPSAQLKKGSTETVLSLATLLFLSPFL